MSGEIKSTSRCGWCDQVYSWPEGIEGHQKRCPSRPAVEEVAENKHQVTLVDTAKVNVKTADLTPGKKEAVDHPSHYGGKDNPYEAIKVIRAWGHDKNFCIGSALKYLARSGKKPGEPAIRDIEKAIWYLQDEVKAMKAREVT